MKLREIMSRQVIRIHPEESVAVAARMLTHYNVGILPVCGSDGRICGLLTDRDIVTRCTAAGKDAERTRVREIMTMQIVAASPETDASAAAELMGRQQIRRIPVLENGRLCGVISLSDLACKQESSSEAAEAFSAISRNVSDR